MRNFHAKCGKLGRSDDRVGSTLPIISINQAKLIKGLKKLKWGTEDFQSFGGIVRCQMHLSLILFYILSI